MSDLWVEKYVGVPYGKEPGHFTCWTIIQAVYRERLGIILPAYAGVDHRSVLQVSRQLKDSLLPPWTRVDKPEPYDGVVMNATVKDRPGQSPVHTGVVVPGGRLLHIEEDSYSVCISLTHWSVRNRILYFSRHEDVAARAAA